MILCIALLPQDWLAYGTRVPNKVKGHVYLLWVGESREENFVSDARIQL